MRYGAITTRLAAAGSDKWAVHLRAVDLKAQGQPIVVASIGEPEIPASPVLTQTCIDALQQGRVGYSSGQGEAGLLQVLADRYSTRRNMAVSTDNIMTVPGTQTALYVAMTGLLDPGDQVLVGDPYYVTYDDVIRAPGGQVVPVPLRPEDGFCLQAEALRAAVTPQCKAILLTTPHNPTGAVLSAQQIRAIGDVAKEHDLWIISDEVYEDLVFDGEFASPLDFEDLRERTVVVSSISKSFAAPGFRSGWIVAPQEFVRRVLPLSETMLFGNQPFIADATQAALQAENPVAAQMRDSYQRRARMLQTGLSTCPQVDVLMPKAGMFVMLDIRGTGLSGEDFAWKLLDQEQVSVLPGEAFGAGGAGFVRVSLTLHDSEVERVAEAITHMLQGALA